MNQKIFENACKTYAKATYIVATCVHQLNALNLESHRVNDSSTAEKLVELQDKLLQAMDEFQQQLGPDCNFTGES